MLLLQHAVEPYVLTKLLVIGAIVGLVAVAIALYWSLWRSWRFWLCAGGLVLLPSLLLLALVLSPPGGGPGYSGSAAAMGIAAAIALSLIASPFVALIGFFVGWSIDRRQHVLRTAKPESHANNGSSVAS